MTLPTRSASFAHRARRTSRARGSACGSWRSRGAATGSGRRTSAPGRRTPRAGRSAAAGRSSRRPGGRRARTSWTSVDRQPARDAPALERRRRPRQGRRQHHADEQQDAACRAADEQLDPEEREDREQRREVQRLRPAHVDSPPSPSASGGHPASVDTGADVEPGLPWPRRLRRAGREDRAVERNLLAERALHLVVVDRRRLLVHDLACAPERLRRLVGSARRSQRHLSGGSRPPRCAARARLRRAR